MIINLLEKILNFFSSKDDADDLMDILSERYKGLEYKFFDLNRFDININSINEAIVHTHKCENVGYESFYYVRRTWYNFFLSLDQLIQWKIFRLKRKCKKENRNIKKILDLKNKYEYNDAQAQSTNVSTTWNPAQPISPATVRRLKQMGMDINVTTNRPPSPPATRKVRKQ